MSFGVDILHYLFHLHEIEEFIQNRLNSLFKSHLSKIRKR